MGRTPVLLVAVLVVASIGIMPGIAVADDDWPDGCSSADYMGAGNYEGVIDSPNDQDKFLIRGDKGDYINYIALVSEQSVDPTVGIFLPEGQGVSNFELTPGQETVGEKKFFENDGTMCISLGDGGDEDELKNSVPYEWQINIVKNSPVPEGFETTDSSRESDSLESQLQQKKQAYLRT